VPVHWGQAPAPFSKNFLKVLRVSESRITDCTGFGGAYSWAIVAVSRNFEGGIMLYWALMFLVVALIAGVLGFTGVAIAAAGIAKLLFLVFLVLFVISLAAHLSRRSRGV
jgi:uncharacterized membrane protein YtjA (UPF0391 family)